MKTWEMIKKLTENPEKKFKSVHEDKSIAPTFAVVEDGWILYKSVLGRSTALYGIGFDWRWEEAKEPVTWEEAFKAGLEGNKIKPEGQHLTFLDYESLDYVILCLAERPSSYKKIMLDKWYIED